MTVSARHLRGFLPALSLALVLAAIAWLNPRAISYFGFNLMLSLALPIALATVAHLARWTRSANSVRGSRRVDNFLRVLKIALHRRWTVAGTVASAHSPQLCWRRTTH